MACWKDQFTGFLYYIKNILLLVRGYVFILACVHMNIFIHNQRRMDSQNHQVSTDQPCKLQAVKNTKIKGKSLSNSSQAWPLSLCGSCHILHIWTWKLVVTTDINHQAEFIPHNHYQFPSIENKFCILHLYQYIFPLLGTRFAFQQQQRNF